ncbi:aspartyl-phosphate phosphatase Spo0E family protein [Paenibacillus lutrae]|uniref:Spo0E family sporulation regulatory protein-aspartic acid phosphatase n=1 Tax=Paenibacillus lutrae TaxID=2078573 RepID=A0A7X3FLW9_9BACL|nr:aspartyl-phosphate phosphatase Spo0E family protein [Paenibacillus lutrae]MVP02150.1 Spo0E family sporulation regulatory protein-aspartic acid phosphatase [Paenibacillus lutrae]
MKDDLLRQIEDERQQMNALANLHGPAAPQVLEQSQKLDVLLNAYYTEERLNA